ncbi:MAG: uroporphyrinogen decarboxylase family protein, partial [Atribacterota bacterium]
MNDTIKRLDEKVDELLVSQQNKEIFQYWKIQEYTAKDHWRGIPRKSIDLDMVPFTVEPEIPLWSQIIGFDILEYYTNPVTYVENTLRMMIYRFENFLDFTCIEKIIPIWLGPPFESTLLGSKGVYVSGESPWLDREPVIKEYEDLDRLQFPDFSKTGLMPMAHTMYSEISEMMEGKYTVVFPEWGRGPFGVAFHIRGFNNLLMDMLMNPSFVHKLMRFITDARMYWITEREKFLHRKIDKGNLYNDEVNCPTLSPVQYEEFVLPYEQELCAFHGGIAYWHSCGDTTKLLDSIRKIPQIDMFHVGPWTDLAETRRVFGKDVALEKCLQPVEDVQMATEGEMQKKLEIIREALDGTAYTVRADGLQLVSGTVEDDVNI